MDGQTPFQFVSDHIHMVGWGAILALLWKTRGILDEAQSKFTEVHKAVTNEMIHDLQDIKTSLAVLVDRKE